MLQQSRRRTVNMRMLTIRRRDCLQHYSIYDSICNCVLAFPMSPGLISAERDRWTGAWFRTRFLGDQCGLVHTPSRSRGTSHQGASRHELEVMNTPRFPVYEASCIFGVL